ncbi:MAG: hypothetical protein LBR43_04120 [Spiroplasmataceae bacterium]|nr:hypothetical protein [Spiroplasmataceae bacterium]
MMEKDNKLLTSLLKRLQELDRENKELKEQLSQQNVKATATNNSPVWTLSQNQRIAGS